MVCEGGRGDGGTYLVLLPGEVAELEAPLDAGLAVVVHGGGKEAQPAVDELFRVLARRAKVDQLDLDRHVS